MRLWQNQVADAVHYPHRRDGRYIDLYGAFDEQHFSSMSAANIIYPLFISLMPRRTEGTQRDSLYPKLEALADDEISHFVEKHETFMRKGLYGYLANLTIVTDAWFSALKEMQHVTITMEW